ncbi:Zinc transporter ZIP11 [Trichoplax sp. H2]|nr:Zinc transporter ZIP11 [Trichoplax sp. H2]|eukprot:RDD39853.1 Zinc transporter ZIP11 [Trichoplax sp. H2]
MIRGYGPIAQAYFGTLFTWGLTAAGAALVFVFSSGKRKVLDGSLGFAAGVMVAASFWSLLQPAIELATKSGHYGQDGQFSFIPVGIGFAFGAAFVGVTDMMMSRMNISSPQIALANVYCKSMNEDTERFELGAEDEEVNNHYHHQSDNSNLVYRSLNNKAVENNKTQHSEYQKNSEMINLQWRRIILLVIAITVHNIPEGLAVGVGFGAIGKTEQATFENARNLAIGIGIQNFPEGLAVSLPLKAMGFSTWTSFWYGQLSGMVEPIAGILGAAAVMIAEPILPYSLAFAAGAMIYVVIDDIIPEAQTSGNGRLSSIGCIVGFLVMMSLDVGLG